MTLVDTSVWVDFFRGSSGGEDLEGLLVANEVLLHPWVLGELTLGDLGAKSELVIADLERLLPAPRVPDNEVMAMILDRHLSGRGIGWVDVHLLASALVARCTLWTFDLALAAVAEDLGLARP